MIALAHVLFKVDGEEKEGWLMSFDPSAVAVIDMEGRGYRLEWERIQIDAACVQHAHEWDAPTHEHSHD